MTIQSCVQAVRKALYAVETSSTTRAYADDDHAGCQDTRRSTSGTLSSCCAQVLWMRSQLTDYGLGFNKIPVYYDTKSLADIFTKALGRERIEFLINKLGMWSFTPKTLKQLADEAEE
ncbi:hypothetical protein Tco_0475881 [Tanacetum coccineum]